MPTGSFAHWEYADNQPRLDHPGRGSGGLDEDDREPSRKGGIPKRQDQRFGGSRPMVQKIRCSTSGYRSDHQPHLKTDHRMNRSRYKIERRLNERLLGSDLLEYQEVGLPNNRMRGRDHCIEGKSGSPHRTFIFLFFSGEQFHDFGASFSKTGFF